MTDLEALSLHIVQQHGRSHGFAVARAIEDSMGKAPSVGSLYKALHRLERSGYLSAKAEKDGAHQGPPRRYYQLTGAGATALEDHRTEHARVGRALGLKKVLAR